MDQHRTISTIAAPGLMTLLDTALYRAHEGQLTATVSSANATLLAFLQLKAQAKELVHACQTLPPSSSLSSPHSSPNSSLVMPQAGSGSGSGGSSGGSKNQAQMQAVALRTKRHYENLASLESFAQFCIESSNDAIRGITSDKLSSTANCDPLTQSDEINAEMMYTNHHHHNYNMNDTNHHNDISLVDSDGGNNHPKNNNGSSKNADSPSNRNQKISRNTSSSISPQKSVKDSMAVEGIIEGIASSKYNSWNEVATRLSSMEQYEVRKSDCWESDRLYCPDYVWADDTMVHCHRLVKSMTKHETVELIIGYVMSATSTEEEHVHDYTKELLPLFVNEVDASNGNVDVDDRKKKEMYLEKILVSVSNIIALLKHDLPLRLHQFRLGIESDSIVTKRLYLLKNEYRAPFRAFLEGCVNVQRLPPLSLVNDYIQLHDKIGESNNTTTASTLKDKQTNAQRKFQDCIYNERFQAALSLEYKCEVLEIEMGRILLPFCDLARILLDGGSKSSMFQLMEIPGVLESKDIPLLQELLRRLKTIISKKPGTKLSTGIRPLLLDLQGIPRDLSPSACEILIFGNYEDVKFKSMSTEEAISQRLEKLCSHLECLYNVGNSKGGFYACNGMSNTDKKDFFDVNLDEAIKACADLDTEKLCSSYKKWYSLCVKQRNLCSGGDGKVGKNNGTTSVNQTKQTFEELAEVMSKAEMEWTIAIASRQALSVVQKRIEQIEQDCSKRFEILQEMLEEVCLREMDFHLELRRPLKDTVLELPVVKTVRGIFDPALEMAGEMMPSC